MEESPDEIKAVTGDDVVPSCLEEPLGFSPIVMPRIGNIINKKFIDFMSIIVSFTCEEVSKFPSSM